MYIPPEFREARRDVLRAFMRANPFAPLVTCSTAGFEATHLPWLAEDGGECGVLRGHLARANPHWRAIGEGAEALVIFGGPSAYISPSWYPSKAEHGRVVPTWNYMVAHVTGRVRAIDDAAWLRGLVTRLTAVHEAGRSDPWEVSDAPARYLDGMVKAIVGVELEIGRIEGKWKLGQNRPAADRAGMAEGLAAEPGAGAAAVAAAIRDSLGR
jgi:transcriptional regulator